MKKIRRMYIIVEKRRKAKRKEKNDEIWNISRWIELKHWEILFPLIFLIRAVLSPRPTALPYFFQQIRKRKKLNRLLSQKQKKNTGFVHEFNYIMIELDFISSLGFLHVGLMMSCHDWLMDWYHYLFFFLSCFPPEKNFHRWITLL